MNNRCVTAAHSAASRRRAWMVCAALVAASAASSMWTSSATAQLPPFPDSVSFWNTTTVVTLNADWEEPPHGPGVAVPIVPISFECPNVTLRDEINWTTAIGGNSWGPERSFRCTYFQRELLLRFWGQSSYSRDGEVLVLYHFQMSFQDEPGSWYSHCVMSDVPSDLSGSVFDETDSIFSTSLSGKCGDWRISAKVTINEGRWSDP